MRISTEFHQNPYARLRCELKQIVPDIERTVIFFGHVQRPLQVADAASERDSDISDECAHDLAASPAFFHLSHRPIFSLGERQLASSLQSIEHVAGRCRGRLSGSLQAHVDGLLQKHVALGQELVALYGRLAREDDIPRQPSQLRERVLRSLLIDFGEVLEHVRSLRASFGKHDLPANQLSVLIDQESVLTEIDKELSFCRDNPSLPVGGRFDRAMARLSRIAGPLNQLLDTAKAECKRQGIVFYNRAGPVQD